MINRRPMLINSLVGLLILDEDLWIFLWKVEQYKVSKIIVINKYNKHILCTTLHNPVHTLSRQLRN